MLTEDQLKLLRYDNCISGKYKNNFDIGLESVREFKNEIDKYCKENCGSNQRGLEVTIDRKPKITEITKMTEIDAAIDVDPYEMSVETSIEE